LLAQVELVRARWWSMNAPVAGLDAPSLVEAGPDVATDPHARAVDLLALAGIVVGEDVGLVVASGGEADRGRAIRAAAKAGPDRPLLVVMPATSTNASLRRALLSGAAGIVLDSEAERALVPTAAAVLAGQLTVPTGLGRQIAPRPLSHREREIMTFVARGLTNREIATRLFLSESTVKTHLSSAFRKLDARSRADAVARITDPESGYGLGVLAPMDDAGAAVSAR
jgi:DNA-binding NarL/FixJ family response regulator